MHASSSLHAPPPFKGWPGVRRIALSLGAGGLGGYGCFLAHVPLAFMIGSMLVITALAMAGVKTGVPMGLRHLMVMVLGIMLGSGFTPDLVQNLPRWSVSLAGLCVYIVLSTWAGLAYLRRVAGYDAVTAYFTAIPGGFNEMVMMGGRMGGDDRLIALGHSLRIMLVVLIVPFAFQILPGYDPAGRDWSLQGLGPALDSLSWRDALLLSLCAVGAPLANRLRMPAGILVGPMLFSAGLHWAAITAAKPPGLLVAAAQIVVGAAIGSRFAGIRLRALARAALIALGLTAALLAVTALVACALRLMVPELDLRALILAYAPGGLAEMSLVALSLHVDAAFVATHHVARIILILLLAPPAFHLWRKASAHLANRQAR
jgi:uncharacterized protein